MNQTLEKLRASNRVKPVSKGLQAVGWVMLIVTVLVSFTAFMVNSAGVKTMYVVSNSMVPTFSQGDLLFMSTDYQTVAPGDIIGYDAAWSDGRVVTHRLTEVEGDTLTVQGDNNPLPDPSFSRDLVRGEIVGIIPKLGYLFNPYTLWGLFLGGVLLTTAGELLSPRSRHSPHHTKHLQ